MIDKRKVFEDSLKGSDLEYVMKSVERLLTKQTKGMVVLIEKVSDQEWNRVIGLHMIKDTSVIEDLVSEVTNLIISKQEE